MDAFRLMLGEDFVPLRVTMQHRRIAPLQSYRDMFGCPVEFQSELNSVHLPNRALTQQIRGRDAAALALAERYLSGIGLDLAVADHVRDLIRRLLVVNQASLVDGCSGDVPAPAGPPAQARRVRNLVRGDPRRRAPGDWRGSCLRPGCQVAEIASMLGYSEQSSYTRACRRWYGESPRQLRARRRIGTTGQLGSPEVAEGG